MISENSLDNLINTLALIESLIKLNLNIKN